MTDDHPSELPPPELLSRAAAPPTGAPTRATRRAVLAGAALAAAASALPLNRALADTWEQNKYPDPRVKSLEPAFNALRVGLAGVERLATGFRHVEGPIYFPEYRFLLFSHIPENRILKWDEETGAISTFRRPSNNANGNTRDRQGRLISCEQDTRQLTRTEYDGSITVLATHWDGKRLNSPNDVVVRSDDSIWFTDPTPGITGWYEGHKQEQELPTNVYRIDKTGKMTLVADQIGPNGLAFSPNEKILYITDGTLNPRGISQFDVTDDGKLTNRRPFTQSATAGPDGIKVDMNGNVWSSWGGGANDPNEQGVRIFDPTGKPIGQIVLPERAHNIAFGGYYRNRIFMTAQQSLYALYVNVQGTKIA